MPAATAKPHGGKWRSTEELSAWIHRRIAVDDLPARSVHAEFRRVSLGMTAWPRLVRRLAGDLPGPGMGGGWPRRAAGGRGDRVRAGQAARVGGGPQAASNRFIHSCSRCQPSGRCKVISPRPWRAVRAATSIRSRRSVAPRALAQARLARDPAARSRLWLIAARASQAALAGNDPEVLAGEPGARRSSPPAPVPPPRGRGAAPRPGPALSGAVPVYAAPDQDVCGVDM